MRKAIILALAMSLIASYAFAAQQVSTSTNFELGSTKTTVVGLSSQVTAVYENGGGSATAKPQWYAIGTYHLAGDKVYGTAQDMTNIYVQDKDPGSTFDWAGMPADNTASSEWSDGVWSAL
jgi:hypothetical protein